MKDYYIQYMDEDGDWMRYVVSATDINSHLGALKKLYDRVICTDCT
jgi:hypothetical protein